MDHKIIELAHLRNRLANEKFNVEDEKLLIKVKSIISNLNSPFKKLALNSIDACERNIKTGDFKSATQEMQLIHNFPFSDPKKWNANYFYIIEFPSYI